MTTPKGAGALGQNGNLTALVPNMIFNYTVSNLDSLVMWNYNAVVKSKGGVAGFQVMNNWTTSFDGPVVQAFPSTGEDDRMTGQGRALHTVGFNGTEHGSSVGVNYYGSRVVFHGNSSGFTWGENKTITPALALVRGGGLPIMGPTTMNALYEQSTELPAPVGDVLADSGEHEWGHYGAILNTQAGGGAWSIQDMTVTTGFITDAPSFDQVITYEETANSNTTGGFNLQPRWDWSTPSTGTWKYMSPTYDSVKYPVVWAYGDQSTVTIPVPRNTTFYEIKGMSYPGQPINTESQYEVRIKPGPIGQNAFAIPSWAVKGFGGGNVAGNGVYYTKSLLGYGILDPTVEYQLRLVNRGGYCPLHSIKYYSSLWGDNVVWPQWNGSIEYVPASNAGGASTGPNKGAIIGGALAGVAGIIILGLLWYFLGSRKGRRTRARVTPHDYAEGEFMVDADAEKTTTPFSGGTSLAPSYLGGQSAPYTDGTSSYGGSSSAGGKQSRMAMSSNVSPEEVVEEEDAGQIEPAQASYQLARIPPRYNEAWAPGDGSVSLMSGPPIESYGADESSTGGAASSSSSGQPETTPLFNETVPGYQGGSSGYGYPREKQ